MPPPAITARTNAITRFAGYVNAHIQLFREDQQPLFTAAVQCPQLSTAVTDFSRTVRLLHRITLAYDLENGHLTIDFIETAEFLQLLWNSFDRWSDGFDGLPDLRRLRHGASTFPNVIRNNLGMLDTTTQQLFERNIRRVTDDELAQILERTTVIRRNLGELSQHGILLGGDRNTSSISQSVTKLLSQEVFRPYSSDVRLEDTETNRLIRACMYVYIAFDLEKSTSGSRIELFRSILSQPGMMEKDMNKARILRIHFEACLRRGYFEAESHEAIEGYLENHYGKRYRDHWDDIWRLVVKIMYELAAQFGYGP